jgi:hypothetical protein
MSGRCAFVLLCAGLDVANGGSVDQFTFVVHTGSAPNADYSPMRRRVWSADLAAQNRQFCAAYRLIPNAADSYAC